MGQDNSSTNINFASLERHQSNSVNIKLSTFIFVLLVFTFLAWKNSLDKENLTRVNVASQGGVSRPLIAGTTATNTPYSIETSAVNLPFIQQLAPTATHTLSPFDEGYPAFINTISATASIATTPTPTPIPPQGESTNFPIVAGALVIIAIVLLSWLVFGRKTGMTIH